MSAILSSLRNTVIAGVVLTIVLAVVAPMIAGEPDMGDVAKKITSMAD